jgi:hypothetical protein
VASRTRKALPSQVEQAVGDSALNAAVGERGEGDLRQAKAAIERTDQDRAGVRSQRFVSKSTATRLPNRILKQDPIRGRLRHGGTGLSVGW